MDLAWILNDRKWRHRSLRDSIRLDSVAESTRQVQRLTNSTDKGDWLPIDRKLADDRKRQFSYDVTCAVSHLADGFVKA